MVGGSAALDALDKFVKLGKELAGLTALVLPQYKDAAVDLYRVCQKLLSANENIARWLYEFQYFDFRKASAQSDFLDLCKRYRLMKIGPERRDLKFRCGDIAAIYHRDIESKIGNWFTDQQKLNQARSIFSELSSADGHMIEFIDEQVLASIDAFENEARPCAEVNKMDDAERARLQFKTSTADITQCLEQFSAGLSELVMTFAQIARVPVTLSS